MRCGTTYGTDGPSLTSCRACGRQGHPGTAKHGRIKNFRRAGRIAGGVQRRAGAQPGLGIAMGHDWSDPSRFSWFLAVPEPRKNRGPAFVPRQCLAGQLQGPSLPRRFWSSFSISASLNFSGTMLRRHIARFVRSIHILRSKELGLDALPCRSPSSAVISAVTLRGPTRPRHVKESLWDECRIYANIG